MCIHFHVCLLIFTVIIYSWSWIIISWPTKFLVWPSLKPIICLDFHHVYMIIKGAKVARSTSAYALPHFRPAQKIRAKINFQKYILGSNPEIPFPTPLWPTTFWYRLAPLPISLFCVYFDWSKISQIVFNLIFHPIKVIKSSKHKIFLHSHSKVWLTALLLKCFCIDDHQIFPTIDFISIRKFQKFYLFGF